MKIEFEAAPKPIKLCGRNVRYGYVFMFGSQAANDEHNVYMMTDELHPDGGRKVISLHDGHTFSLSDEQPVVLLDVRLVVTLPPGTPA